MMKRTTLLVLAGVLVMGGVEAQEMVIHDLSDGERTSALGTEWEGFSDQVMGGVSTMSSGIEALDGGYGLHMTGSVSLENNGGFVQVRLPLGKEGNLDASEYSGVAVEARGIGDDYYLHLRTPRTFLPWAHYAAPLPVGEEWRRIEVPFSSFEPKYMVGGGSPNVERLNSIAVVAAFAEFEADIWVRKISFYH
jgi:hypothetical protein